MVIPENKNPFTKFFGPKLGFTLVEALIGFGVAVLFLGGLIYLYMTGSQMFNAGSWKLHKQKEAQIFLNTLKERLEQASSFSRIDPAQPPTTQLVISTGTVFSLPSDTNLPNVKALGETNILLFTISKPDKSSFGGDQGLSYYHALKAGKNGLFLYASSDKNDSQWNDGTGGFPMDPTVSPGGLWGLLPSSYQFPDVTKLLLTDVSSLTIHWGLASGTGDDWTGKVWSMAVKLEHPNSRMGKHTFIEHAIQAKISFDVAIASGPAGGL